MGLCEDDPSCDKTIMRLCLQVVPRHVGDIAASWVLHIGSYILYEDLYRSNCITTYVVPFVIGMLLARDLIIGIIIPSSISLPASLFTRSVIHHPATNSLVAILGRLIVMCITERAQRYLSDNRSDKS